MSNYENVMVRPLPDLPPLDFEEHIGQIKQDPHAMLELVREDGDICALVAAWYAKRDMGTLQRLILAIDDAVDEEAERRIAEPD